MAKTEPEIHFQKVAMQSRLDLFLAEQGMGFNAYIERRVRLHDALALNALSDAELAYMGLSRRGIPAFVFAELLGD